jgi:hypothetical protein
MTRLQLLLLVLLLGLVGLDLAIVVLGGFTVDLPGYGMVALLSATLAGGGLFYRNIRPDSRLAAMLFGTAFLCAFSASAGLLNYLLLPVAGVRIDAALAAWDRSMGFSWPAIMAAAADQPALMTLLLLAYGSMLPQIALLAIALARRGEGEPVYRFCLAIAAGALFCIGIWTLYPSFGAFSIYELDDGVAARISPALGTDYAHELTGLLANGTSMISPSSVKGLIGFPSYHAVLALLAARFAWDVPRLRWPFLVLNLLVMLSVPVQGGHHLLDLLAAFPVTWAALKLAGIQPIPATIRSVVNKSSKLPEISSLNRLCRTRTQRLR